MFGIGLGTDISALGLEVFLQLSRNSATEVQSQPPAGHFSVEDVGRGLAVSHAGLGFVALVSTAGRNGATLVPPVKWGRRCDQSFPVPAMLIGSSYWGLFLRPGRSPQLCPGYECEPQQHGSG